MGIEKLLKIKSSKEDKISMIISNNIDLVVDGKSCVSVDNWQKLENEILQWHNHELEENNPLKPSEGSISLLKKYMMHVEKCEGVNFVNFVNRWPYEKIFSEEEASFLQKLDKEIEENE